MVFDVESVDGEQRVIIFENGVPVFSSPDEGLWSVALGWEDGWPTQWQHAHPARVERSGLCFMVSWAMDGIFVTHIFAKEI